MPIYEFECQACGHRFDRLQKLSDPDPSECERCGAPQVQRALTAPQFRLKGGGWYETDFKRDGEKKRNLVESGGGEASPAAASSEAKSGGEAKPSTEAKPAESKPASPATS
jgi:putative FmdB family regulatory protein